VVAARLHLSLLAIHPFLDGNGRTSRLASALLLIRGGFRSTLFTAVEQHFHSIPLQYLEVLDQYQYGEINEGKCVAMLLQGMVANSMYAAWFRARELRLRNYCNQIGVPGTAIEQTLIAYDLSRPNENLSAKKLANFVRSREIPLSSVIRSLTKLQQMELSFQIERLLDEEDECCARTQD
jgi:Fic family protein